MLGAICGDIVGSVYEWNNIKTMDFPLFTDKSHFTDDSVLTLAVADAILSGVPYQVKLKEYYHLYPHVGYGQSFRRWAESDSFQAYNSWGNGSAMRVSPIGFAFTTLEVVLSEAEKSARVTHNHPEGIKGAQAVAAAVFLARKGSGKAEIKEFISGKFAYNLDRHLVEIRPHYQFDVSCQGSVPEAMIAFLESEDYQDAIRKAISLGGDSDTVACIAGGIAQAFYKHIPEQIARHAEKRLTEPLRIVLHEFSQKYPLIEKKPAEQLNKQTQ